MNTSTSLFVSAALLLTGCTTSPQQPEGNVKIIGQMKTAMWNGEIGGRIYLDTIANREHLFGLGPLEYLRGEILIIDGRSYKSTVQTDTTMKVEETYDIKAPFFGYANIEKWTESPMPDSIQSIEQLERHLDRVTASLPRPLFFKLTGTVQEASIHVVNLPKGTKPRSPREAHRGRTFYTLINEPSEIIGFFSTEHQTVFTHHDSYVHMHLITNDRQIMGHLDKVLFNQGSMKLYLPLQ